MARHTASEIAPLRRPRRSLASRPSVHRIGWNYQNKVYYSK
jgi:hypothetical protein